MEGATYEALVDPTFLDPTLRYLEELNRESHRGFPIEAIRTELKFFKMFLWGLVYWEESEYDQHLFSVMSVLVPKLLQITHKIKVNVEREDGGEITNWKQRIYPLFKLTMECKRHAKESCLILWDGGACTLKFNSDQDNQKLFASFSDLILDCLQALLTDNEFAHLKAQIIFYQGKLKEFSSFSCSVNYLKIRVKKLSEFIFQTQPWICYISRLVYLYWTDGMTQSLASSMETFLLSVMHKIMPYNPGVIASYFEATTIPYLFASYFDSLLEDLAISIKGEVEILHEGLIFLVSFVMDPPEEDSTEKEQILAQMDAFINGLPSLLDLIRANYEMEEGIYKHNFLGFLEKVDEVKAKVSELYVNLSPAGSSQLNSPQTHPIGFLDLLLTTMKRMFEAEVNFVPSTKHHIESIQKQLELLKPLLQGHISLQNGDRDFKDLWTRTIDVLYHASYVTEFCLAKSCYLWYGIVSLPNVIENIKLIKAEFQKIEDNAMYKNKILCVDQIDSSIDPSPQSTTKIKEVFIDFKKDVELMVEYLTRGRNDLTIISISGMPGQGKTTLARKIRDDARIRHYFYKIVWCNVSKECKYEELLERMGRELHVHSLEAADIANNVRRSLLKQRYLIVMDDIWDVALWNQVQILFPNDRNGSRILFTSRNLELASQTGVNYVTHPLQPLSEEESWELFSSSSSGGSAPPEFLEIAKQILRNCNGLPLAVAVIASLLERIGRKLDLWNEVAENLKSHLKNEGCMNVIELSYKYLPEYLKPCFLYFGVFPRGEKVAASKLKRLWMSEGFIKDDGEMQYSEEALADKYLDYLVSQNMVIVVKRGSRGGIKQCNVHDLLYDMCLEKAKGENFVNWMDEVVVDQCSSGSQSHKYNQHRLSIRPLDPFIKSKPICTRVGLPVSPLHSVLWPFWDLKSDKRLYSQFICEICKRWKLLTVLDLETVYVDLREFPKFLTSLIHLRYLALYLGFILDGIPMSITNLWNLETLVVRAARLPEPLPVSMWNMKRLRYVRLPYYTQVHLEEDSTNTIEQINNSSLTTLGKIEIADVGKMEELFRKLPRLRKFKCSRLVIQEDIIIDGSKWPSSIFASLTQLESLYLWGLELPDSCERYRPSLSFSFPKSLTKLILAKLRLPWSALSTIGKQLQNLLALKLYSDSFNGSCWAPEDGDFPKLRYLYLSELDIEELDVSACCDYDPFPYLEKLVVEYCKKLKEIPSSFGEIASLNSITIGDCNQLKESVSQILENQRILGNKDLQLYIKNVYYKDTDDE